MVRVLIINVVCGTGSTGKICVDLARSYESSGDTVKIAYGRGGQVLPEYRKYGVRIGSEFDVYCHGLLARVTDRQGCFSKRATEDFLKWADRYHPDEVWLHNIHGYYLNYEMLFRWIKEHPDIRVKWTLHDCWAFTGHCTHFMSVKCDRWREQCEKCPQKREYPASILMDHSKGNYVKKKESFCGVKNMTLITPSRWLADLVRESFLKEYPVEVVYNQIDKSIFRPTQSDFRQRYGLEKKTMILGVASVWNKKKGLDDFIELSHMLDDSYAIVLVGLTKRQIKKVSKRICGIGQVKSGKVLAKIYSETDVFVNPSREETFGMTTVEASMCGAKTIVYEGTACEEVAKKYGGIAVPAGVEHLYEAITGKKYVPGGVSESMDDRYTQDK